MTCCSFWSSSIANSRIGGIHEHQKRRPLSFLSGSKSKDDESNSGRHSSSSSSSSSSSNNNKKQVKTNRPKSKKFTINQSASARESADKLAAAFDELARKEGFDPSMSYFADDATFEDDFENNDDDDDDDDEHDDDESLFDDMEQGKKPKKISLQAKGIEDNDDDDDDDDDFSLDPSQFDLSHFVNENDLMWNGNVDQSLLANKDPSRRSTASTTTSNRAAGGGSTSKNTGSSSSSSSSGDDMQARMTAAKRGIPLFDDDDDETGDYYDEDNEDDSDVVVVPDLRQLGFRREANPFGIDETPRQRHEQFQIVTDAMVCTACGSDFQSHNDQQPGYLPPEKFAIQVKLHKIQEMQRLQEKATSKDADWTTDDEIEWLLQTSGKAKKPDDGPDNFLDIESMAEAAGLDLIALSQKRVICKRCHGLQNFGKVEDSLRPGWSQEPLLSQEKFRNLLRPIRDKPAVIIALVDLFDFAGSVLPELDAIAGEDNPVILAANKVDLLPSKMGTVRAENWVRRELEYLGVKSLGNAGGGAVRLISCKTGIGVQSMMAKAQQLADEIDGDIYVVGAANAGKSTLLNQILSPASSSSTSNKPRKRRAGNSNARKGAITTSPLPGTTLQFIKVELEGGRNLYDTPGLLVPGTLTQLLTPEELKIVVPRKTVEPITFRVAAGKCVLVGGLARIELVDSKPFFFTFFVANDIKLHPTDASRADDFVRNHAGGMLTPPLAPGPERLEQLGEFEEHVIDIQGRGWQEAAADITLTGLGWVAVTGAGTAKVRVSVPKGIGVVVRPPLMPFDVWEATAKYTGGRAVRKSTRSASGKRRKGVGRQ
jgi:30S ribosome assembly GTPase